MTTTDVIIIGAGPGGYRAAEYAAKNGLKVVIIESGNVGGTCLNVGCIPTKTYVHAATFEEARERMAQVVPQLRQGVEGILSHPNITIVRAEARFVDDHTVETHPVGSDGPTEKACPVGSDGPTEKACPVGSDDHTEKVCPVSSDGPTEKMCPVSSGSVAATEVFTAPSIIIATGSETKWLRLNNTDPTAAPPLEGREVAVHPLGERETAAHPRVVDSTGLLQLDTLPQRLCIIGAGVIGMEFASVFRRFGSEVTVIEYLKECLPALDSDIAKRLRKQMEKDGITFNMQCAVKEIADGTVFFEDKKGKTQSVEADVILMATGRKPRTDGLNLEAAGITLAPNGAIAVDNNYIISNLKSPLGSAASLVEETSNLYAIGDVNGRQMLAHAAEMQAMHAVNHILGKSDGIRFDIMPAAIFTSPEAACVGPTEEQLKAEGTAYVCKKAFWRANGKALAMNEGEGLLKLFVSAADGLILGCHAFGAHSADIIQEVSVLMCGNTTVAQLTDMVHIHPTLGEILRSAAEG